MPSSLTLGQFLARVVLVIFALAVAYVLWQLADVLLLAFAGLLLAVFLRTLIKLLKAGGATTNGGGFLVVVTLLLLIGGAVGWFTAPRLSQDLSQLSSSVPEALGQISAQLTQYGWAQEIVDQLSSFTQVMPSGNTLFTRVTGPFRPHLMW
ncbi:MAG: hypothetical protein R2867_18850 [Caldilineaceae bacterium]